jgi:hypothetical protein
MMGSPGINAQAALRIDYALLEMDERKKESRGSARVVPKNVHDTKIEQTQTRMFAPRQTTGQSLHGAA